MQGTSRKRNEDRYAVEVQFPLFPCRYRNALSYIHLLACPSFT